MLVRYAVLMVVAVLAGQVDASADDSKIVYGCRFGTIWRTPGHHPVGFISQGQRFRVTRSNASGRWVLGTGGRQHGWVRRSNLCRTPPDR